MKYVKKETKRQQKIRGKKNPSCMSGVGNKKGIRKKPRRKWQWSPQK